MVRFLFQLHILKVCRENSFILTFYASGWFTNLACKTAPLWHMSNTLNTDLLFRIDNIHFSSNSEENKMRTSTHLMKVIRMIHISEDFALALASKKSVQDHCTSLIQQALYECSKRGDKKSLAIEYWQGFCTEVCYDINIQRKKLNSRSLQTPYLQTVIGKVSARLEQGGGGIMDFKVICCDLHIWPGNVVQIYCPSFTNKFCLCKV